MKNVLKLVMLSAVFFIANSNVAALTNTQNEKVTIAAGGGGCPNWPACKVDPYVFFEHSGNKDVKAESITIAAGGGGCPNWPACKVDVSVYFEKFGKGNISKSKTLVA